MIQIVKVPLWVFFCKEHSMNYSEKRQWNNVTNSSDTDIQSESSHITAQHSTTLFHKKVSRLLSGDDFPPLGVENRSTRQNTQHSYVKQKPNSLGRTYNWLPSNCIQVSTGWQHCKHYSVWLSHLQNSRPQSTIRIVEHCLAKHA